MKISSMIVMTALVCLSGVAAAETGEPSVFIRQFRSGMIEKGYACEIRQGDLLCVKDSVLLYASSSREIVERAKIKDAGRYCENIGENEMKVGFVSQKGFKKELVLSASITTSNDLVCVISYL